MLQRAGVVGSGHTGHGHIGAVHEEDEYGQQADDSAQHAEADDATAAQAELLDEVPAQEGATPACGHHHVACGGGKQRWAHSFFHSLVCCVASAA